MTDADRRVASFAAVFAQERAPALVARLSGSGAPDAVRHAARLAAAPREERLRSLSGALAFGLDAARVEAAAALERPALASILRALGGGEHAGDTCASPVLVRLCRERLYR